MGTMPNIGGYNFPAYGGNQYFNYGNIPTGANPFAGGIGSSNLSAGNPNFTGAFTGAFGQGLGQAYSQLAATGGYNPAVFNALVNQMQPQIQSGVATLGASAGAAGNRFGSGYELGLGDYLSQVNANEMGMAANLYQQSIQNQMGILQNTMPYIFQNEQSPGFWGGLGESLLRTGLGAGIGALTGGIGSAAGSSIAGALGLGGGGGGGGGSYGPGTYMDMGPAASTTFPSGVGTSSPTDTTSLFNLSNMLQTPGISSTQSYADILGMNFSGQTGSNILSGSYGGWSGESLGMPTNFVPYR